MTILYKHLDLEISDLLYRCNIHETNIHKIALSKDEKHIIIFVKYLAMTPLHIQQLSKCTTFCRLDFINSDMITFRFKVKETTNGTNSKTFNASNRYTKM